MISITLLRKAVTCYKESFSNHKTVSVEAKRMLSMPTTSSQEILLAQKEALREKAVILLPAKSVTRPPVPV